MFQVLNTRTNEIKVSTPDLIAADIMVDRENYLEIGVGYEPCWVIQYVNPEFPGRKFYVTCEEQ